MVIQDVQTYFFAVLPQQGGAVRCGQPGAGHPAAFDQHQPALRPKEGDPVRQGARWIRQRPEHVPGQNDVERGGRERRL